MASTSTSNDQTNTLTLQSSDGEVFTIPESAAVKSMMIKNLVEDVCANDVLLMANVDGPTLAKVVEYLKKHDEQGLSEGELTKFDEEFVKDENMNGLFGLVTAANYMHIKDLLELTCQKIADTMKDQSPEWVRETFSIENDFTLEEEEDVRNEYPWAYE